MKPTSYLYDERDGGFRLYLGGISTLGGLNLFPRGADVTEIEYYTDAKFDHPPPMHSGTTAALIDHIAAIPDHIGFVDFSCVIESEYMFSTHDDCECHFKTSSEGSVRILVDRVTAHEFRDRLWVILNLNRGCHTVIDATGQFHTYPDFDTLLESRNGG